MNKTALVLKAGREKPVLAFHPWIFSGAIDHLIGSPDSGATIDILSSEGTWIARAAYSPVSNIRARIWTWKQDEIIDGGFFRRRVQNAIKLRVDLGIPQQSNAYRLVHGESDGLPGLIVDRYADVLVMQVLTAGMERWKDTLVDCLAELTGLQAVYERSDVDVRGLEGLTERVGLLKGECQDEVVIQENGHAFRVDIANGQKTGFFLDQRVNRKRLGELAFGKVLNCFSYSAAFNIYALKGMAASVTTVDSSASALELGRQNYLLNQLDPSSSEWVEADVFAYLRRLRDEGRSFDTVILDPPKFAPTAARAERAARAYKDINLLAFKLLNPGGLLFTFSCSGGVSSDLFTKIVAGAALDAGVQAVIVEHLHQAADHPVALAFPEGAYLKGLICRKA